jgi:adenylylsulfate kinase
MSTNITWHSQAVNQTDRWTLGGHRGAVVWFTGLSGAGKSSIANVVEHLLNTKKIRTYLLDGDNIRHGLCKDLSFTVEDRAENIRRVGEVSKLMADSGVVTLAALISPYRSDRDAVRQCVQNMDGKGGLFIEVYVQASVETCEGRDPKGLYKMAREGKIKNFTGIDDLYEEPTSPELILNSNAKTIDELAQETYDYLIQRIEL